MSNIEIYIQQLTLDKTKLEKDLELLINKHEEYESFEVQMNEKLKRLLEITNKLDFIVDLLLKNNNNESDRET